MATQTPGSAATVAALDQYEHASRLERTGDVRGAVAAYQRSLAFAPGLRASRQRLALLLVQLGRRDESLPYWHAELRSDGGVEFLSTLIVEAMQYPDLRLAGDLAAILAALRWGSAWYPPPEARRELPLLDRPPEVQLSLPKLRHDSNQLRYLQAVGAAPEGADDVMAQYEHVARRHHALGPNARWPLDDDDEARIGHVYGRILHLRETPRRDHALSDRWDRGLVQDLYRQHHAGVVVIDDFVDEAALEELRRFCLESTIWSGNRYADGRLGAFFFTGFNCPLLLQIAEEIRAALSEIIGPHHPLRQLWAFKNTCALPENSTIHADFAAVNVNFWITPDSANLDDSSGGMLIYDVAAPPEWDFHTYNERIDVIRSYLGQASRNVIRVPYRQNRAIIFNSDLFHATERVGFRPGYLDHRINVTMLYGEREHDAHHPWIGRPREQPLVTARSWRSAALRRRGH